MKEATVKNIPNCQFCMEDLIKTPAIYDGKTKFGPWAFMCELHMKTYGIGLGTSRGQKLIKKEC